jgi:predicted DNA-binding protein YlxM (UPF0122 family)
MPMNDAKTMGSLEEKLMSYVSTTPQQDANYDIALAMLTHYGKLKNLSLAEIADLCYVSKASISRFCRFMGFDGFRELHDCLLQDFSIRTDYSRTFYDKLCADPQAALQHLCIKQRGGFGLPQGDSALIVQHMNPCRVFDLMWIRNKLHHHFLQKKARAAGALPTARAECSDFVNGYELS